MISYICIRTATTPSSKQFRKYQSSSLRQRPTAKKRLRLPTTAIFTELSSSTKRAERTELSRSSASISSLHPARDTTKSTQRMSRKNVLCFSQSLDWYKQLYGASGGCFVEITLHPEIEAHKGRMQEIEKVARQVGLPLVAAHDVYYLQSEDSLACDLVNKIRTAGFLERDMDSEPRNFSFLSQAQINELFVELPEALDNTIRIAEMCKLELKLG